MTVFSWVDGKHLQGGGERFETVNPATGRPFAQVHAANAADVEAAVASAQRGFEVWSAMTGAERGRILQQNGRNAI
ncbi:MAG: aldehyde dehydrogenase family protein [Methylocystis sp.]|nr:aldehyde dehydrogenase family protein [Methylocystis sp.]